MTLFLRTLMWITYGIGLLQMFLFVRVDKPYFLLRLLIKLGVAVIWPFWIPFMVTDWIQHKGKAVAPHIAHEQVGPGFKVKTRRE